MNVAYIERRKEFHIVVVLDVSFDVHTTANIQTMNKLNTCWYVSLLKLF
jgi:hypothetical protein